MAGRLNIRLYIGVGGLCFGMGKGAVEAQAGPPTISNTGFLGEVTEYRRDNELLATGFHDDDIDQKAVTVFERGRWNDLIPDLKPFVTGGNGTHRP